VTAACAAGVYRFIVDDFGWGPDARGFPEFDVVHARRRQGWDHAAKLAKENDKFTWTGLTTGNPIDWVSFCSKAEQTIQADGSAGDEKVSSHGLQCQ
jgi:hypothetical protein